MMNLLTLFVVSSPCPRLLSLSSLSLLTGRETIAGGDRGWPMGEWWV